MAAEPTFLFVTCQIGAENALKQELARDWPGLRFSYSRPGFLTFKLTPGVPFPADFDLRSVFARAAALSLGRAEGTTDEERMACARDLLSDRRVELIHVWPRDAQEAGSRGYEPGVTAASEAIAARLRETLELAPSANAGITNDARISATSLPLPSLANGGKSGQLVGDVVLVSETEWWVGVHRVHSLETSWAGGFFPAVLPEHAVSRVYLKMLEAIHWSGLELRAGERCAEIGCAPGGASQALLDCGLEVVGIDPAEMPATILGHPRFRHIRRRSKEVRRRDFVGVNWLTCDINLPPNYTLDTVESILSYPEVKIRGLLLTLKLIEWNLAENIPEYLQRVRSWGYNRVHARQLHHNRQEICVAAS